MCVSLHNREVWKSTNKIHMLTTARTFNSDPKDLVRKSIGVSGASEHTGLYEAPTYS